MKRPAYEIDTRIFEAISFAAARLAKARPRNIHKYDIDHIVPLTMWDKTTEHMLWLNSPFNLQWLTKRQHMTKTKTLLKIVYKGFHV